MCESKSLEHGYAEFHPGASAKGGGVQATSKQAWLGQAWTPSTKQDVNRMLMW